MPFGLTNAPATWQRVIDRALDPSLSDSVFTYLDDIIIISSTFDQHLDVLSRVFDCLSAAGLVVSQEKCQFCLPQLKYLGFVVNREGLSVDVDKVQAILDVSPPRNVTEVRRFVGMASWYRRFVKDFASIVAPLTSLTKKRSPWKWTAECQKSFEFIKNSLVSAPILTCPDFSRPFILQTDASAYGLGAVLTQNFEDGEKVICFLSRSLSRVEQNYSTTERECLAVIWAVEKLRHYLEGTEFTVITDHHSLLWLDRLKDPTGRLARWAVRLQPFRYKIIHRKGKDCVVPDFLSRSVPVRVDIVDAETTPSVPFSIATATDRWYKKMVNLVENLPDKYPRWRVENGTLYKYVEDDHPELSRPTDHWKLVVPKECRSALIREHHEPPQAGHGGIYKTFWRLHHRHYWPKMRADVAHFVRACRICAAQKPEQKKPAGLMGNKPTVTTPWQMISLDFMGPLPRSSSGNTHILVVTDFFSKFVVTFPLRAATAKALTKAVEEHVFLMFGVPQYLICDNGVQMKSNLFQQLCEKYKVRIIHTPSYCPRPDHTERVNRIVKTMLASYVKNNHRKWDENLAAITCAIRTAKHETTGYSPYFANFGREYTATGSAYDGYVETPEQPPSDVEQRRRGFAKMYATIAARISAARERDRKVFNRHRRPVHFQVGDSVWIRNHVLSDAANYFSAKLADRFVGPYRVIEKLGNWVYRIQDQDNRTIGVRHVQDMKPATVSDDESSSRSGCSSGNLSDIDV